MIQILYKLKIKVVLKKGIENLRNKKINEKNYDKMRSNSIN
jgi:hypothetical protein